MALKLSQQEMQDLVSKGKTAIWQYNTLYQIEYSRNIGAGEHYLRKVLTRPSKGMGVTLRGRFIAMEPEHAQRFL